MTDIIRVISQQWPGFGIGALLAALLAWLGHFLLMKKEHREAHVAHASAWRGTAEGHKERADTLAVRKKELELDLSLARDELAASRQALQLYEQEVTRQFDLAGLATAELHQSLILLHAIDVSMRNADSLLDLQQRELNLVCETAVLDMYRILEVDRDKAMRNLESQRPATSRELTATLVDFMLQTAYLTATTHSARIATNTALPLRIVTVLRTNPQLDQDGLSAKVEAVIAEHNADLFGPTPVTEIIAAKRKRLGYGTES